MLLCIFVSVAGMGTNLKWNVTVAGLKSAASLTGVSYPRPQVSSYSGIPMDTRGGFAVIILGQVSYCVLVYILCILFCRFEISNGCRVNRTLVQILLQTSRL